MLWVSIPFVPLAGYLADRLKHPEAIFIAGGCFVFAALMAALAHANAVPFIIVGLAVFIGLPAGSIMSFPARVLAPATRAIGMGVFFTIYYVAMMLGPVIGGACAKWTGSAAAALDFGVAALLACPLLLWTFNRIGAQSRKFEQTVPSMNPRSGSAPSAIDRARAHRRLCGEIRGVEALA